MKPFRGQELTTQERGLAGKRWVMRAIRRALGKLQVTGDGIDISQSGDGQLVLKAAAGVASSGAFKVELAGGGVRISPGYFYAPSSIGLQGSENFGYIMPEINGQRLDKTPQPIYPTTLTTGYVVVRTKWSKTTGAPILPWPIGVLSSPPTNEPLIRFPASSAQDGTAYCLLASFTPAGVVQAATGTIFAGAMWESILFYQSAQ